MQHPIHPKVTASSVGSGIGGAVVAAVLALSASGLPVWAVVVIAVASGVLTALAAFVPGYQASGRGGSAAPDIPWQNAG